MKMKPSTCSLTPLAALDYGRVAMVLIGWSLHLPTVGGGLVLHERVYVGIPGEEREEDPVPDELRPVHSQRLQTRQRAVASALMTQGLLGAGAQEKAQRPHVFSRQTDALQHKHLAAAYSAAGTELLVSTAHAQACGDVVGVAGHAHVIEGEDQAGLAVLKKLTDVPRDDLQRPLAKAVLKLLDVQDYQVLPRDAHAGTRPLHLRPSDLAQAIRIARAEAENAQVNSPPPQFKKRGPEEHCLVVRMSNNQCDVLPLATQQTRGLPARRPQKS
mmetsp:Transcript_18098/g.54622  ORF Transcript_18098/g.54622 Transcript_18098/m.54622 type:complete len:272 (-) Transcript_18098:202-1017(-)